MEQQKMHYKEISPEETVERLKEKLDELGITMEEQWFEDTMVETVSLRILVKGTNIGSNGKGINKAFARASAYAEFFERFQNQFLYFSYAHADKKYGKRFFEDEIVVSAKDIAGMDNTIVQNFFEMRGVVDAQEKEKLWKQTMVAEEFLYGEDMYYAIPFYNAEKENVEYLPHQYLYSVTGSNGMCAGNSPEEAIAQGLSEIFERYVQQLALTQKLCFPDVPEEEIARFPYIYERYERIRSDGRYSVVMKECSMGGKYPVAALIVTEKDSGVTGVKFGSHPDFGIAMERTLTEATQGNVIGQYCKANKIDFSGERATDIQNVINTFKVGIGYYPSRFFESTPDYEFTRWKDVSGLSNQEVLDDMLRFLQEEKREMLVRDVSFTGFYSYLVVIPGMSDIFDGRDFNIKIQNTRIKLLEFIQTPEKLNKKMCRQWIGVLDSLGNRFLESRLQFYYYGDAGERVPGEELGYGWLYLSAMLEAYVENYAMALKKITHFTVQYPEDAWYRALATYMGFRSSGLTHQATCESMTSLFSVEWITKIEKLFENPEMILSTQFPKQDISPEADSCTHLVVMRQLMNKLILKQREGTIRQEDLKNVLGNR